MENFNVNEEGYYGEFGGIYVPPELRKNIEALSHEYLAIVNDKEFCREFRRLLRDYVGRPSPLYFAPALSDAYGARIYLKREDLNHTGAHKINNAVGQVLMARRMKKKRIIAETGAGQHGVAAATVCALLGMECVVYMGAVDVARQALNVKKMEMLGAEVISVTAGAGGLKEAVDTALDDWCRHIEDTHYIIGSAVGPHPYPDMVARFQSVISEEIKKQLSEHEGRDYPDYLIACIGGGSNAAGTFYHYLDDGRVSLIVGEGAGYGLYSGKTAATLSLGRKAVMHGSVSLVMLGEDGNPAEPYSISAGLDYPGVGPLHANLAAAGRSGVYGITDDEALQAGIRLTRMEGIIPALESAHALAVLEHVAFKPDDVVVVTISGRGDKDMEAYLDYYGKITG